MMDTLLIIVLVILSVDIATNIFRIIFDRMVVEHWKWRVRVAEDRAKLLTDVLRQVECEDLPEGEW